jgi:hypothetical protein
VFMAGGSMPVLPVLPNQFLIDASSMKCINSESKKQWTLSNGRGFIVYAEAGDPIKLNLSSGSYQVNWIDPVSGKKVTPGKEVQGGKVQDFSIEQKAPVVLWVRSK